MFGVFSRNWTKSHEMPETDEKLSGLMGDFEKGGEWNDMRKL